MAAKKRTAATATRPHGNTGNKHATGQNLVQGNAGQRDLRINLMQEMFAQAYARTGKVAASALEAGYSPDTCESQGSQLLRYPKVAARIAVLVNEKLESLSLGREHFFIGLAKRASAALNTSLPDVAEFDAGSLNLRDSSSLSAQQRLAVKKVSSSPGQNGASQSVELHDAVPMVALLAKLGGWEAPQRVEQTTVATVTTTADTSVMTDEQLQAHISGLLKQS